MSLANFDFSDFWEDSDDGKNDYIDEPVTPELVRRVEATLGYKLPASYVELAKHQNGGLPVRMCHRASERTSWSHDHVAISGIFAIGESKPCSLLGAGGSRYWIESEWGYPAIGVYFADCPSAGHDMLCLDYSECGPSGEPRVVHVDQEFDYKITFVAPDFESFIRGLRSSESLDEA